MNAFTLKYKVRHENKINFINQQITVFKTAEEKWLDMFYEYGKLTTEQRANDQHRRTIKNLSLWVSHDG